MAAALLVTAGLAGCQSRERSTPTLTISDQATHQLSPLVFGQFLERPSWSGESGPESISDERGELPKAVEEHLAGMRAPVVRFPHGTDGDYVDWTDMIDLPTRASRPITVGHTGERVSNRFGFAEYISLADRMNWKSILVVNLRDALYDKKSVNEAAAHAAAMVAYCAARPAEDPSGWAKLRVERGVTEPLKVEAIQVGNEGWFFWPPKEADRAKLGLADEQACVEKLRAALIAYADAIHNVLPGVTLIADAPQPLDGGGAKEAVVRVWHAAIDHDDIRSRYKMLAAHAYAPMGMYAVYRGATTVPGESLSDDEAWYALVATLGRYDDEGQSVADAKAYGEIASIGFQAAVTEWNWNGWGLDKRFPQVPFREGLPAALSTAGFLNGMMRHPNVALATQSMLLGTRWGITSVRVAKDGSVGYLPQAEVTRLFAEHHGSYVIKTQLANIPQLESPARLNSWWPQVKRLAMIDCVVTGDAKAWYVHVVNRDRIVTHTLSVELPENADRRGTAMAHQLTADPTLGESVTTSRASGMKRSALELEWSGRRLQASLPAASVSVIIVPK